MLKTTRSFGSAPSVLEAKDEVIGDGGGRVDEMARDSSKSKKSKNNKSKIPTCTNIRVTGKPTFLTSGAREAFNQLRQVFTKAPILRHFDLECHIQIETDAAGYAIGGVLSQLTSDQVTSDQVTSGSELNSAKSKVSTKSDLNQWHPVAYFSRKMIPAETRYKTHNAELLAIIEAFKTWKHYLEGCKHKVLVVTDHHNLCRFMDTKSLSSRQVWWAQELSKYHFWIDYCQGKVNGAVDVLSRFPQRSQAKKDKLRAENTRIFHKLHSLLTRASLSGLSTSTKLLLLHQVVICGPHVLSQLRHFWETFQTELAKEKPYKACIGAMRLRLAELQESDKDAKKFRATRKLQAGWEDIDGVLHYQGLRFVPEAICIELINWHHDDFLAGHFGIDETKELIGRKYHWPSLRKDVEAYVKGCNVCLGLKAVRHKPYSDLQLLPVPTHRWKDLLMDFGTGLPISTNWKGESYDSILVIIYRLMKMVHYEPVKVTINAPGLAKVIINVVVWHHSLPDFIMSDRGSLFTLKFWLSLCYFLGIKRRLSTAFHPQTDGQTERQNSTIEAYLWAFVNFEQNDWGRLLLMAEFAYNNAKNANTGHTPFKLNCGYYPRVSFEENTDPRSQSKTADELSAKLRELMIVCRENLQHAQELQKQAHDKGVKPKSYAAGDKIWLNSKYIKTKQNRKLEAKTKQNRKLKAKFFGPFLVLHLVGKQAYKLELSRKWKMHDVFHVSVLE